MTQSRDVLAQNAATGTGNGTVLNVQDMAVAGFQMSGTFSATVTFEATVDGNNWTSLQVADISDGSIGTTATATGIYSSSVAGLQFVRARISTYGSGSVTIRILASQTGDLTGIESVSLNAGANSVGTVGLDAGNNNVGDVDAKLIDENGTPYGVKQFSNSPLIINFPKSWAISEGIYTDHTAVNKFGHNSAVGAALEPIWDFSGAYEYLADDTFATMYISSDAAADQSMTYDVTGLDSDYNYSTVTATTDGSDGRTFVALTSDAADDKWWRIFRALNTSGTVATGNIYISKDNTDVGGNGIPDTTSDIQAQILIGFEQTLMALWSCPVDNEAFMTSYYAATSSNKVTEVHLFVRPFGQVFNIKHVVTINQGAYHHDFDFPVVIDAKSDIKVEASASGGGGEVSAGFDLWFES